MISSTTVGSTTVGSTKMIKGYNNSEYTGSPAGRVIVFRNKIENRCNNCNRLLFMGIAKDVAIKCKRCGKVNIFRENNYLKIKGRTKD